MYKEKEPLQVKASPVFEHDIKSINYCVSAIQKRFGDVFPEEKNNRTFFLNRVEKLMKAGVFFIVYLPALTKRGAIPVGLFQIDRTQIACLPQKKAAILRNVCIDKEIWGQSLGTSLLLAVFRIACEMQLDYLIGHIFKFTLIGTFYKLAHPISGRIANTNYLGIPVEPMIFNVREFKEIMNNMGLQHLGLLKKRRRHSLGRDHKVECHTQLTSKL